MGLVRRFPKAGQPVLPLPILKLTHGEEGRGESTGLPSLLNIELIIVINFDYSCMVVRSKFTPPTLIINHSSYFMCVCVCVCVCVYLIIQIIVKICIREKPNRWKGLCSTIMATA